MKRAYVFLTTCYLISCGWAQPATVFLGYQDSLGQYSFGYSAPGSARSEVRTLNGETHGAYSYIDGAGVIQSTQYVADGENGFRVIATNLPESPLPVQDTAEVVAARIAHLQAVELARNAVGPNVEEKSRIGVNNIFLQGLKLEERQERSTAEKRTPQVEELKP